LRYRLEFSPGAGTGNLAQIDFKANAGGTRFGAPDGAAREGGNLQIKNGDNLYPTTIVVKAPLKFE